MPEIVENYRDYVPSFDVKKTVTELLSSVPPGYLAGLKRIVLTNRSSLTRDQRRQKIWQRGRKHQFSASLGAYYRATRSRPAAVWLFVDNLVRPFPRFILRMHFFQYVVVASTLYHEVGHHIHAAHRPVYDGKENVAEDWSRKLSRRFFRPRYWYLIPLVPLLRATSKVLKGIQRRPTRRRAVADSSHANC